MSSRSLRESDSMAELLRGLAKDVRFEALDELQTALNVKFPKSIVVDASKINFKVLSEESLSKAFYEFLKKEGMRGISRLQNAKVLNADKEDKEKIMKSFLKALKKYEESLRKISVIDTLVALDSNLDRKKEQEFLRKKTLAELFETFHRSR